MKKLSYLLIAILITGCGPGQKKETELSGDALIESRHDEVMVIHDEVMPKMGTIRKLKKDLQGRMDSLLALQTDTIKSEDLNRAVKDLEEASDAMMVWMRAYTKPASGSTDADVISYFDTEMKRVMSVRDKMLSAIEKAESLQ